MLLTNYIVFTASHFLEQFILLLETEAMRKILFRRHLLKFFSMQRNSKKKKDFVHGYIRLQQELHGN